MTVAAPRAFDDCILDFGGQAGECWGGRKIGFHMNSVCVVLYYMYNITGNGGLLSSHAYNSSEFF